MDLPTNKDRAERFYQTLEFYGQLNEGDDLVDLITDMMHWSQQQRVDLNEVVATAGGHFEAECEQEANEYHIKNRG